MAMLAVLKSYERHISAAAMVGGFLVDNLAFGRIDHPATQAVLATYLLMAAGSIILLHYFEERAEHAGSSFRWSGALSAVTQFAFGGLWSAFLIFYSRSAVIATSWPFLLILACIFLGNEVFRDYRSRLVFTAILLFFAIFSYATFTVPIIVGALNSTTFLLSDAAAVLSFVAFIFLVALLARSHIRTDIWKIAGGALVIGITLNILYYMALLPPLPLVLIDSGVFSSRASMEAQYHGALALRPWYRWPEDPPTYSVQHGQPLYAYSAVFAPRRLATQIVHEWQWYDERTDTWATQTVVAFPILGGRENGYRGYSTVSKLREGAWRIDVETRDGRAIGRMYFNVKLETRGRQAFLVSE